MNRIDLSSRPISAIFVRPQGFMEYSNVTWSPRGMTADESCYYRKPWSSSFSSQPHSQGFSVSIGGNVVGLFLPSGNASSSRAKFRVIVSFFWRHLMASKNDTTVISTYIMHISADRIKELSSGRVKFAAGLSCHYLFLLEISFWHPKTTKLNLLI